MTSPAERSITHTLPDSCCLPGFSLGFAGWLWLGGATAPRREYCMVLFHQLPAAFCLLTYWCGTFFPWIKEDDIQKIWYNGFAGLPARTSLLTTIEVSQPLFQIPLLRHCVLSPRRFPTLYLVSPRHIKSTRHLPPYLLENARSPQFPGDILHTKLPPCLGRLVSEDFPAQLPTLVLHSHFAGGALHQTQQAAPTAHSSGRNLASFL